MLRSSNSATEMNGRRCRVGQGVAVLCGTHPELDTHWLEKAAATTPAWSAPTAPCLPAPTASSSTANAPTASVGAEPPAAGKAAAATPSLTVGVESPASGKAAAAPSLTQSAPSLADHTANLSAALHAHQAGRSALWKLLLEACCTSFSAVRN